MLFWWIEPKLMMALLLLKERAASIRHLAWTHPPLTRFFEHVQCSLQLHKFPGRTHLPILDGSWQRDSSAEKVEDHISKSDDELKGMCLKILAIPMLKNELRVRSVSSNFPRKQGFIDRLSLWLSLTDSSHQCLSH